MAAVTSAILAGTAIAGGAAKAISGAKQKRDGKRAASSFRRQTLTNVHAGRRISTQGSELAREEQARATASSMDALRSGGVRGVAGGAGKVVGANNLNSRQIAASLDAQQVALDSDIANDEARIQGIQENRDNAELSNIQQQINAGNQQMWSGIGDVASGVGGAVSGFTGGAGGAASTASGAAGNYSSVAGAAKANAGAAFGNVGSNAFNLFDSSTMNPINPLTGKPYIQ